MLFHFEKLFHLKLYIYRTIMLLWTIPSLIKTAILFSFKELLLHQQKLAFEAVYSMGTQMSVY